MVIAIIPAREGSKRIPKKNIRKFHGRPMLERTINKLLESDIFDSIYVSTDSEEIANIALKSGASVPFMRSKTLADDFTGTKEVISSFLEILNFDIQSKEAVCCIYSATPLLKADDIMKGLDIYRSDPGNFVTTATAVDATSSRHFSVDEQNSISKPPLSTNARTQDLEIMYRDAGQMYIGSAMKWFDERPILSTGCNVLMLPRWRAIDIDNEDDWKMAEILFSKSSNLEMDKESWKL